MTNTKILLFLQRINDLGRLMTEDEAFDFYTEFVMRNQPTCKWNPYKPTPTYSDYSLFELKSKAQQWHKMTLGSLILAGRLPYFLGVAA